MRITLTCLNCSKEFTVYPYRSKSQFCCYDCRRAWNTVQGKRPVKQKCQQCGKDFASHASAERLYCSKGCYWKSKQVTEQRTCPICDKTFDVCPSEPNRFCSRTCRDVWQRNKDERICKCCGETFVVHPHRPDVYCSHSCAAKINMLTRKVNYPVNTCEKCGNHFEHKRKELSGRFCSRACSDAANKLPIGINQRILVSSIEKKMQSAMQDIGMCPIPQYAIGPYTADFAFDRQRLVIECDGTYWHGSPKQKARDRKKDGYLKHAGWQVLRLSESDINLSPADCAVRVQDRLQSLTSSTS